MHGSAMPRVSSSRSHKKTHMIPIKKELRRKTNNTFLHYRKAIVVELLPNDVIQLRLYGQRNSSAVAINISDLNYELVR
jgi:hypothetical protein